MRIFSDIDGTFLAEGGAAPFEAPEFAEVRRLHPVVFASSRTAEEIRALQGLLGFSDWAIAEDGSVLLHPDGTREITGLPRAGLVDRIGALGGASMLADLSRTVPVQEHRIASILLPRGVLESHKWLSLRKIAESANLRLSAGGQWATLSLGSDKGMAVTLLARRQGWTADVGIGNDANDLSLLRAVHRGFVIRNSGGHHPALAGLPGVTLLQRSGPAGWKEMLDTL